MKRRYTGRELDQIAYPMGGLGAGMLCLQGTGALGNISVRNEPNVHFEPNLFAAVHICGRGENARILEAPVPGFKVFSRSGTSFAGAGNGLHGKNYGLPRFSGEASFEAAFPFATVRLADETVPLEVSLTGWSPFIPGDEDRSGMPFAAVEYQFRNTGSETVEAIFSFQSINFMGLDENAYVEKRPDGFILRQPGNEEEPWKEGAFYAFVDEKEVKVDAAWFRGGWFDSITMLWNQLARGETPDRTFGKDGKSAGGSLAVPFTVKPGESRTIALKMCWYVPDSKLRLGDPPGESSCCCCGGTVDSRPKYQPWYSLRYPSVLSVREAIRAQYDTLREESVQFRDTLAAMTLPDEIEEAIEANLSILKSPTILRQTDGRLWGWEGCCETEGCCHGSCTHVWNYAQAICHLFPRLERTFRQTEFHECQNEEGHQHFRAPLPIRPAEYRYAHAASDGQLGGIMKFYRDWKIKGEDGFLREYWPLLKTSMSYCIRTWDPDHEGILKEPHHNTYDIEFWGPEPMCTSFYLGALKAMTRMAEYLGEDASEYRELFARGRKYVEEELFNGEYFVQQIMGGGIHAEASAENPYPETRELLEKEGPKYQYGTGCLSDGVLGAWMAEVCGLGEILDPEKVRSHLNSVYRYNFRKTLQDHANPQRPGYALGKEGGLLLCSWPRGGKLALPFVYSDEVWTGIEYQVASHLILMGEEEKGREIVRTCRARYDGIVRNPFDEYECGHWYARAMASYSLIQAYTGIRYEEAEKTLYFRPHQNFSVLLACENGYGLAQIQEDTISITPVRGSIEVRKTVEEETK
ncbi:MAG: GH116 family glycosyl hydrolase [Candidatus Merdivicinus sp.]|jgi:uncharacterized protein (DUF608 family)